VRIALISDIHGNIEALTAVCKDIESRGIDRIFCLGDIVGYGCNPLECIEVVKERCEVILMGNHDQVAAGDFELEHYNNAAKTSAMWTREQLDDSATQFLMNLPMEHRIGDILFVHSSPWQPEEWHYIMTREDAKIAFNSFTEQLCFYGHTHMPMIFCDADDGNIRQQIGHDIFPDDEARYLVNIGSVGQPRDDDPRACYVSVNIEDKAIDLHRVEYDIVSAQRKMTDFNFPEILIERLAAGR
jgi:predicted phosphodiesterase